MSKYDPLRVHLRGLKGDRWRASFGAIEKVLGFQLPAGARARAAWWTNHARDAGFKAADVDVSAGRVTFARVGSGPKRKPVGRRNGGRVSPAERAVRVQLAACYRLFARDGWDDLIFTHLTARVPGAANRFLMIRFGELFEEVTASSLITLDVDDPTFGAAPDEINRAGWVLHSTIFKAVPSAQAIMHLHTTAGIAVSCQKNGLLPVNQFAIARAGQVGYHEYDGPNLDAAEQKRLVRELGNYNLLFLRNHGTVTHGASVAEAYTLMRALENACAAQIAAQAGGALALPSKRTIEATHATIAERAGGPSFSDMGFAGLMRKLDREQPDYRH